MENGLTSVEKLGVTAIPVQADEIKKIYSAVSVMFKNICYLNFNLFK